MITNQTFAPIQQFMLAASHWTASQFSATFRILSCPELPPLWGNGLQRILFRLELSCARRAALVGQLGTWSQLSSGQKL